MIKVAQEGPLLPEDFFTLKADPVGPITHGMNLAVHAPTGVARTMSPATSDFGHAAKGGGIHCRNTGLCLRSDQAHLLPLPGTFALSFPRPHGADHRAVRFGDDLGC